MYTPGFDLMTERLGWDKNSAPNATGMFNAGTTDGNVPAGETDRQAVHALGGYVYQIMSTALAWLDIKENSRLFLEVAEDYATVAKGVLEANQVKHTKASATVTLMDKGVRDAVHAFVVLVERNPHHQVMLRFLTTSEIGTERAIDNRPAGQSGLTYWRSVALGASLTPLRDILANEPFSEAVQRFCRSRDDDELRRDLILRIHWDCGMPPLPTLRQELQARLIVLCRDKFNIAAPDARQLLFPIAYRVLDKCISESPNDRVLTLDDLYTTIDSHARTSVPITLLEELIRDRLPSQASLSGFESGRPVTASEQAWLTHGSTRPAPRKIVSREAVQSAVDQALAEYGVSMLFGSSGIGKSVVCRAVADLRDEFFIADFRHCDANDTHHRLDLLFGRIGGLPPSALILEDLNQIDDDGVAPALARVIDAARRHDHTLLLTSYEKPDLVTFTAVDLDSSCAIECPYFTTDEVHAFVRMYGGVAEKWGDIAYVAGAFGHPQLTHAFVAGMAMRGWPADEIEEVLRRGFSSDDLDAARKTARKRLLSTLPEGARDLLYRLSLTTGRFSRAVAVAIGRIPQPVPRAGECMDLLTGPWIENVGKDAFRVSPLAMDSGRTMLPADEQRHIHEAFAFELLASGTIDANDANSIMMHAIAGESGSCLVTLATSVLAADSRTLTVLTDHFSVIRFLRTDAPIFPVDLFASILLRVAQFKVTVSTSETSDISKVVTALFDEITNFQDRERKRKLEELALFTVLNTMGVANHVDDWVSLLLDLKHRLEIDGGASEGPLKSALKSPNMDIMSVFFDVGSTGIETVDRLEYIITQLDGISTGVRDSWLTPINDDYSDYSVLINGPWAAQQRAGNLVAADAVERYRRMEKTTRTWGLRALTLQCVVAQATILDECLNDSVTAARVLQDASEAFGGDPILQHSIVKVLRGRGEHRKALVIFRGIEDRIGKGHPIMGAFALREAAISAGKCNDWSQAERWFLDARDVAKRSQSDNIGVMQVGLCADSAVAALEAGDVIRALTHLAEALEALNGIDPETTLHGAYCHRAVRVVVLWASSRIEGKNDGSLKDSDHIEPGLCSDPIPSPEVLRISLVHLDVSWYVLAIAEIAAGVDVGVNHALSDRLKDGPIRYFEAELRIAHMRAAIDRLNASEIADHFTKYIDSAAFLLKQDLQGRGTTWNRLISERGQIPSVWQTQSADPVLDRAATDAIISYFICCSLAGDSTAISKLVTIVNGLVESSLPGKKILDHWSDRSVSIDELSRITLQHSRTILENPRPAPDDFWIAGLRFFEWIDQGHHFKRVLLARLASWMRKGWQRIVTTQKFLLLRPTQAVPAIEEVLGLPADDRAFVAKLILVTESAVGHVLGSQYLDRLRAISEE